MYQRLNQVKKKIDRPIACSAQLRRISKPGVPFRLFSICPILASSVGLKNIGSLVS
jgi:hypothetical protein